MIPSRVFFSEFWNFYKLKRGGRNFWEEPILQEVWIIWSHLLYFNFKSCIDTNFSSFIRFQGILHDSRVFFSEFWNFYKLKNGVLISGGNQFCKKCELFYPPLLYFNFKSFMDPNSLSFIRFQCILYDSEALFSKFWDFYKLKRGDLISGRNQFCWKSELFGPPFSISVLKVLSTKFLRHLLDFSACYMIKQ